MKENKKVTWSDVYREFRKTYPNMAKRAMGFEPYDFATILVFLPDGERLIYDYDAKRVTMITNSLNERERRGS